MTRERGAEGPFTEMAHECRDAGKYACVRCGNEMRGRANYNSGFGWPGFRGALSPASVAAANDLGQCLRRAEARCDRCDAHLGQRFDERPQPTGQDYCIDSAALRL